MKITYTFIMKVLPALLAALCWTSCSDFLEEDPKGQLPSDTYFSNKGRFGCFTDGSLFRDSKVHRLVITFVVRTSWWETIFPLILQVISSLSVSMISLM